MAKTSEYLRSILALTDVELEQFILDWVNVKKQQYVEVVRFSGSGDMGRDVVGFVTDKKHEGEWHNYQCKQYRKSLPTDVALHEIGKIIYFSTLSNFILPEKYFFVAPKGVNRNLEKLLFNPTQFKNELIAKWDEYCSKTIVENQTIPLSDELKNTIENYNFSTIHKITIDDLLRDPHINSVLFKWFNADPGPSPKGVVPSELKDHELPYISQLLEAYSEKEGALINTIEDLQKFPTHCDDLKNQRERFYEADAFKRFYRDNTNSETMVVYEEDIFNGVIDVAMKDHENSLNRIRSVMSQAASVNPSGVIGKYARVSAKQGTCHHFVNDNRLRWKL